MEFLEVEQCEGLESFLSIPSKSRLKYFRIGCDGEPERIEISAPSLETLYCFGIKPCSIDFTCCTGLKRLKLGGDIHSGGFLHNQHILSKLLHIEEYILYSYRGAEKLQISSSCLKRLCIYSFSRLPHIEIDTPNLLSLELNSPNDLGECSSNTWFSLWNVPKVKDFDMILSVKNFQSACRGGLKGFLMKLQNYEDLKLLIHGPHDDERVNLIMHEKLHAVSFSSLNKFLKRVMPTHVIISCKSDESLLTRTLRYQEGQKNLSLISSSRRNIEVLHKKLSNDESVARSYSEIKLVPIEEIEHEMDTAYKSFEKVQTNNGYHGAGMIFVKRSLESILARCGYESD